MRQVCFVTCLLALTLSAADVPPPVATDFTTPLLAIPYLAAKPTIDGTIHDDEWSQAAAINALRTTRGAISTRQTLYYLGWDEENLYLAMRSWLRPGERPIQKFRGEGGDPYVVMDDSYEFYFDVDGLEGALPAFTQYIGNFAGEKYDCTHLPTVGTRRMSYEAGWKPANHLTDTPRGRAWDMEVVIPRASILHPKPFAPGDTIHALLARNYKRPWEQNSIEGTSLFRNSATYSRLLLTRGLPAIRLLSVGDSATSSIDVQLAAAGPAADLAWHVRTDSGLDRTGKLGATPVRVEEKIVPPASRKDPVGMFRIQVTAPDGSPLLDWAAQRAFGGGKPPAQPFTDDDGDQTSLDLVYNPERDYLRISGDFINYDNRDRIAHTRVTITGTDGKLVADSDHLTPPIQLALDEYAFVRGVIQLPGLAPGAYTARLVCTDQAGATLIDQSRPFEKKDPAKAFPWWHTKAGSIDRVIAPWTPVTWDGATHTAGVWGRTIKAGAAGLPASISTQGQELLAAPIRLEITLTDGTVATLSKSSVAVTSQADHRLVFIVDTPLETAGASLHATVTTEFDGMYKAELLLDTPEVLRIKSWRMVVPFRNDAARYLTACGEGIRWGYDYRDVPTTGKGRLWDCRKVDGQRMTQGSFIPYVYIGNPTGGLAWFADSDRGWLPSDTVPAIELRRDSPDSTDLVFNFISEPATVGQPGLDVPITFAFQATPVKPLVPGWRHRIYDFGDSFAEWQCAQKIGSSRMQSPVPWTYDVDKCNEMIAKQHARGRMLNIYPAPVIPYGRHNEVFPRQMPEASYFQEAWQSKGSWHIHYGQSLTDYWIYQLDQWLSSCDLDGYYSDDTYPALSFNAEAGHAYRLPDGRVQPAYNIFGIRRYFLRVRAVFAEHGKQGWIVTHMTHNMVIPWLGACDIALDGEDHHVEPRQNRTWLDAWTLERLRGDLPHALGVAVTYKTEFEQARRWEAGHKYTFDQVWRSYCAGLLLHDAIPMTGYGLRDSWFLVRQDYGFNDDAITFIPYYGDHPGIAWDNRAVQISAWSRPGSLLLMPVGFQRQTTPVPVTITLDPAALGLPPVADWYVHDPESHATYALIGQDGQPLSVSPNTNNLIALTPDGKVTLNVGRHDYRYIVIQARNAPAAPPAQNAK